MSLFITGLINGVNVSPLGYLAPAIILWKLLVDGSENLTTQKGSK